VTPPLPARDAPTSWARSGLRNRDAKFCRAFDEVFRSEDAEVELGGGKTPGGGRPWARSWAMNSENVVPPSLTQVPGPMAALKVAGSQSSSTWTCLVAPAAEAPTAGTSSSSATTPAIVARRRVRCGLEGVHPVSPRRPVSGESRQSDRCAGREPQQGPSLPRTRRAAPLTRPHEPHFLSCVRLAPVEPVPAAVSERASGSGRGSPRRGSPLGRCWAAPPRRWYGR
jgi:hypothetical protein